MQGLYHYFVRPTGPRETDGTFSNAIVAANRPLFTDTEQPAPVQHTPVYSKHALLLAETKKLLTAVAKVSTALKVCFSIM